VIIRFALDAELRIDARRTMDLYAKVTGENEPDVLVTVGRVFVILFVLVCPSDGRAPFLA